MNDTPPAITTATTSDSTSAWYQNWGNRLKLTLPQKLLILTMLFVLIVEVLVFIPSVAKHRNDWFQSRVERAHIAALTLEMSATEIGSLDDSFVRDLFQNAEIIVLTIARNERSENLLAPDFELEALQNSISVDLRTDSFMTMIAESLGTMFFPKEDLFINVTGEPRNAPGVMVDLIVQQQPLRRSMWAFARSVLAISAFIAIMVAGLIYASLIFIFVRPMMQLTGDMAKFQAAPENPDNIMKPSGRQDEIGIAENMLASMQLELRDALRQRAKLATLGEGVSKINHDLRNVLSSAMLMSDRLAKSDDPRVQKLSPRLVQALSRAVALCRATLDFGRIEDINKISINMFDLVDEVEEALKPVTRPEDAIEDITPVRVINNIHPDIEIKADRTQIFRALFNLSRNSAEVLSRSNIQNATVNFDGTLSRGELVLQLADNGPGIPEQAREHLFTPFKGSMRSGGTGLGLAIASEVVLAHEGKLELLRSDETGTVFQITLPA